MTDLHYSLPTKSCHCVTLLSLSPPHSLTLSLYFIEIGAQIISFAVQGDIPVVFVAYSQSCGKTSFLTVKGDEAYDPTTETTRDKEYKVRYIVPCKGQLLLLP